MLYRSEIPFTKSFDTKIPGYAAGHGVSDFFHPGWVSAVDSVFREAFRFKDNKYLLGYFVDNEQGWGKGDFSGFLETLSDSSRSREVWVEMLRRKYKTVESLNQQRKTTFSSWEEVRLLKDRNLFPKLQEEIITFETAFAAQYFRTISSGLKKYDPNHLYLGCRFTRQPKPLHIMQTAGKYCDVITVNVYTFIANELEIWHNATQKPILIGEHHVPLASERQFPPNYKCFPESERKEYYLKYVERWAKMPFSLGCHWYQFADQHLTGRSTDGECQTVGLVDIADQPHPHMIEAVNKASKEIYNWHQGSYQQKKHPYLLFHGDDVKKLKQNVETAEGQSILIQLKRRLNAPPEALLVGSYAAGYAFLYQLTGEIQYAVKASHYTELTLGDSLLFESSYETTGVEGIPLWNSDYKEIYRTPNVIGIALAYDMCYNAWDKEFREKVAAELAEKGAAIIDGGGKGYNDKAWMDLHFGMFIHFGINTMKYIVIITKRHDGFCLWPGKHTAYSVASSPWKGDLVAEMANSAASKETILNYLNVSRQMEANLLLNCGPMASGKLRPEDEKVLKSLLQ